MRQISKEDRVLREIEELREDLSEWGPFGGSTEEKEAKKKEKEAKKKEKRGQDFLSNNVDAMKRGVYLNISYKERAMLTEKSQSKSQQRFMGMVYAYKNGELDTKNMSKSMLEKVKKAAEGMTKKEAEKFASTKHKGIPEKVKKEERILSDIDTLKEEMRKNSRLVMGEAYKSREEQIDDLKPIRGEEKYVEYDEEYEGWGVFGNESGFCYGMYGSKGQAEDRLEQLEESVQVKKMTLKECVISYIPESLREDYDPDEDEGLDHEFGGDPDHYAGMNYAPEREVEAEENASSEILQDDSEDPDDEYDDEDDYFSRARGYREDFHSDG